MDALLESGTKEELTEFLRATAVSPARPWNILCITFTNKAAGEFKQRLETMLGPAAKDIWRRHLPFDLRAHSAPEYRITSATTTPLPSMIRTTPSALSHRS